MKKDIGDHIISKLDLQDIVKVLSDELSGSELNTVLLDVFNKRVGQVTPSSLLSKYEGNKLVKPALLEDVLEYKENELRCYKLIAGRGFEPIELFFERFFILIVSLLSLPFGSTFASDNNSITVRKFCFFSGISNQT